MGVGRWANNLPPENSVVTETEEVPNTAFLREDAAVRERGLMKASSWMTPLLSPKEEIKVGCWNVRTLFAAGKLQQVSKEMDAYGLEILGLSEVRWTGEGKEIGPRGETILYTGSKDKHENGVAIMIKKDIGQSLMEWRGYGERIIKARFFSNHIKLTVVQCYAPTNNADQEEKDEFYSVLGDALSETSTHDMVIVMGDLNAKVGSDNTGYENVIGRYGHGVRNEDLCQDHSLVI